MRQVGRRNMRAPVVPLACQCEATVSHNRWHLQGARHHLRATPVVLVRRSKPQHGSGGVGRRRLRVRAESAVESFLQAALQLYKDGKPEVLAAARPADEIRATAAKLQDAAVSMNATQVIEQPRAALQLVRLAEYVDESEWVRPLSEWEWEAPAEAVPEDLDEADSWTPFAEARMMEASLGAQQLTSLLKHLLVKYDDVPPSLLNCLMPTYGLAPAQHWARTETPFMNVQNWTLSRRFTRALVGVGAGGSATKVLKAELSPAVTKGIAHAFMTGHKEFDSPLLALRRAQVEGLGGSEEVELAACESVLGLTLGSPEEEEFAQALLQWVATRERDLGSVNAALIINHLLASYKNSAAAGEVFSLKGRTVSGVLKTAEDVGELFAPSGLQNMRWEEERPGVVGGPQAVEVTELLSARDLVLVGNQMLNCLQTQRGMMKYCHRARNRSSSFWVVTFQDLPSSGAGAERAGEAGDEAAAGPGRGEASNVELMTESPEEEETASDAADEEGYKEYALVFEVWNESKIIHQAEGPQSRIASQRALRAMERWADAQEVVWTTWEVW